MKDRFFGDRAFYRKALLIAVPIMVQNGITNFVNMLDNIMVGRVGTKAMSGVAIVNQLMFVYNLCIFGGLAGIGIFTAQFFGKGDEEGVRHTFRLQIILSVLLTAAGAAVFLTCGPGLISLYLKGEGAAADLAATHRAGMHYLAVMYAGLFPFALTQVYSMTLRSCGETMLPMKAGIAAVIVNLAGNYILIYGKFGFPALGVAGAAAATVLSRLTELGYIMIRTHADRKKYSFISGAYRHLFRIPSGLVKGAVRRGTPLLLNEALWSGGQAVLSQIYSLRGLNVVAAYNISSTITNLFNISFIAMGSAISILIGQELGAGRLEEARRDADRLAVFTVLFCGLIGAVMFAIAPLFPKVYQTSDEIRALAAGLIRTGAVFMPMYAYLNATYFTIRSGGKTVITFIFDSCFAWVVCIPLAWVLAHYTDLPILQLFFFVQLVEILKCAVGFFMIRSGMWVQDLTKTV